MQAMSQDEQKKVLAEATERRATLSEEIRQLADRRDAWLKDKVKAEGGAEASLDRKIYEAVKTQAAGAGLRYSADAPRY